MTSTTLRKRLLHGDVDGRGHEHYDSIGSESLNEPLLGRSDYEDRYWEGRTLEDIWDEERKQQQVHWTLIFSQLIVQWAQWIANIVLGSGSLIGRLLPLPSFGQNGLGTRLLPPTLSPLQKGSEIYSEDWKSLLMDLELSIKKHFVDATNDMVNVIWEMPWQRHIIDAVEGVAGRVACYLASVFSSLKSKFCQQSVGYSYIEESIFEDALRQLWKLAYPNRELPSLKSELWKEMGWQGTDPSTDFRGGGFISLENLIYFANKYPVSFQRLLHKQDGTRAEWEYPFAVAGINVSFMLAQMLDLQSGQPSSLAGIRFLDLLEEDEMAFDNLFCIAFQMMDAQWLAKRASYMDFNDVLKSTRTQLERELALEDVSNVKDLPAYNLLRR